jgi:hypothetical protein
VSFEERERFFALVCSGLSLVKSAAGAGVSLRSAVSWWQRSGLMSPQIQQGRAGGLPGSAPARVPGAAETGAAPRQRRPLSTDDRAVIGVGLRFGCSYAQIGGLIGRDKSVVCREVARHRGPDGSYWAPVAHAGGARTSTPAQGDQVVAEPGTVRADRGVDGPGLVTEVDRRS